jgi:hypothetical protein
LFASRPPFVAEAPAVFNPSSHERPRARPTPTRTFIPDPATSLTSHADSQRRAFFALPPRHFSLLQATPPLTLAPRLASLPAVWRACMHPCSPHARASGFTSSPSLWPAATTSVPAVMIPLCPARFPRFQAFASPTIYAHASNASPSSLLPWPRHRRRHAAIVTVAYFQQSTQVRMLALLAPRRNIRCASSPVCQ